MFHSYFNEYAFDDINIYLLTSSCTLHRRKFRTNVSVHICINVSVLACKSFSISLDMSNRKVNYMDVISHTCSVRSIIVISEYSKLFELAYCHLCDVRHEVVWNTVWILTHCTTLMSSDWIEVTKKNNVPHDRD